MAYYGVERTDEYIEHAFGKGERKWKKPVKYIDRKWVNGKWVYIYDNLKKKANYAVKRGKKLGEQLGAKAKYAVDRGRQAGEQIGAKARQLGNQIGAKANQIGDRLEYKARGAYYSGKSKVQEQIANRNRKKAGITNAATITTNYGKNVAKDSKGRVRLDYGKANYRSGSTGARKLTPTAFSGRVKGYSDSRSAGSAGARTSVPKSSAEYKLRKVGDTFRALGTSRKRGTTKWKKVNKKKK